MAKQKRLWSDASKYPTSLGCLPCPHFQDCGGMQLAQGGFSCLDYCCEKPQTCQIACRNNPSLFVESVYEVGGLALTGFPNLPPLPDVQLPTVVPLIYHGKRRSGSFAAEWVCLSLHQLYDRRTGQVKFNSKEELLKHFKIQPTASIIVSGVEQDDPLERLWAQQEARAKIYRGLRELGVELITTPNFSTYSNWPRTDNLHNMKRIAISFHESFNCGLQTALHINSRNDHDWTSWANFLVAHPEIRYLSYEFATGARNRERQKWHLRGLLLVARLVRRPLGILVRGGPEVVQWLREAFQPVVVIETSTFLKTMYRQKAITDNNSSIGWNPVFTFDTQPLDELMEANFAAIRRMYEAA